MDILRFPLDWFPFTSQASLRILIRRRAAPCAAPRDGCRDSHPAARWTKREIPPKAKFAAQPNDPEQHDPKKI